MRRWGVVLFLCCLTLPALLVFDAGPARAGVINVIDMSQYVPEGLAGDAVAETGVTAAAELAPIPGADIATPVLIAGVVGYEVASHLFFSHPQSAPGGPPVGSGTSYGQGHWGQGQTTDGLSQTEGWANASDNPSNVNMTIETAVQELATSGTVKVYAEWDAQTPTTASAHGTTYRFVAEIGCSNSSLPVVLGPSMLNQAAGFSASITLNVASCASRGGAYVVSLGLALNGHSTIDQTYASYYFGGAPTYPQSTNSTMTPNVQCSDGSTVVGVGTSYDTSTTGRVDVIPPRCPAGTIPTRFTVADPAATSGNDLVQTFPSTWTDPQASPYPDCLPGGAAAPCVMRLGQQTATGFQECGQQLDCTSYTAQPAGSTATSVTEGSATYECLWGTYQMPVISCDGMTQQAEGTTAAPSTTDPTSPSLLGPPPGGDSTGCFPSGWGLLNPVSWVVKPLMCLFIPSRASQTKISELTSDASTRAPVSIITGGSAWVQTLLGSGTADGPCSIGWPVTLGPLGTFTVLGCNDPVVGILRSYRDLVEVALFAGFLGPLMWWGWKQYAPGSQTG